MTKDPDQPSDHKGQIPLLDDVVFNTELPIRKPKPKPREKPQPDANGPRPTDLFGGSPETARTGPYSPDYPAQERDGQVQQTRRKADEVVNALVAEYSREIMERLRDELTTVLADLNQVPPQQVPSKQVPSEKDD